MELLKQLAQCCCVFSTFSEEKNVVAMGDGIVGIAEHRVDSAYSAYEAIFNPIGITV